MTKWRGQKTCPKPRTANYDNETGQRIEGKPNPCKSPCPIFKTMKTTVLGDDGEDVEGLKVFCARTSGSDTQKGEGGKRLLERHKVLWDALLPDSKTDNYPSTAVVRDAAHIIDTVHDAVTKKKLSVNSRDTLIDTFDGAVRRLTQKFRKGIRAGDKGRKKKAPGKGKAAGGKAAGGKAAASGASRPATRSLDSTLRGGKLRKRSGD